MNYDHSDVGVPYVRINSIKISWPDNEVVGSVPTVDLEQTLSVKLADNSIRIIEKLPTLQAQLDFSKGEDPVPLRDMTTGNPIGMDTSLNKAMFAVFALVRDHQLKIQG